jgi:hypothetical protein
MSVNLNSVEPLILEMNHQKMNNTGEGFSLKSSPDSKGIISKGITEQKHFCDTHNALLHAQISQELDSKGLPQNLLNNTSNLPETSIASIVENAVMLHLVKKTDARTILANDSLMEILKSQANIFPLMASEFSELNFELKEIDTNMSSFLGFASSILSLDLASEGIIQAFEFSSAMSGNSSILSNIVPVRLLPLGALGNGYLSNLPSMDIYIEGEQIAIGRNALSREGHLSKLDALADKQIPTISYRAGSSGVVATLTATQAQKVVTQEVIKELSNSAPALSEIAKRYLLLTPNEDGAVLWYRDYKIDDVDLENMYQRLSNNDFIKDNNIKKMFVNGELFWIENGEGK